MKTNHTIAITGANGFVGKHLQNIFSHVVVLHHDDSVGELLDKLKGVDDALIAILNPKGK